MLQYSAKRDLWREYIATVAHSLGSIICGALGNEYPLPSYSELMHPEQKDTRTSQDIINGLIDKLS